MSDVTQRLASEFSDPEYRHGYADDFLNTSVAAQIKALRDQRGWTQAQLAERARMKPSRISAIEDVNYSSWSVRTLARLAEAFDVALAVCFKSFGERIADIERFSSSALLVPSYLDDLLLSFGVGVPPKLSDASPLFPLRTRLIQAFAEFVSEPTPDGALKTQRYADQLVRLTQRIYRSTTKEHRENTDWTAKLLSAVSAIAQGRVLSKEQEEQAVARIKDDAEIQRLQELNKGIASNSASQVKALQDANVLLRTRIDDANKALEARLKAIDEAAHREIERITTFREAVLGVIAEERERIRQLATATAKSDISVEQFLRETEEGWRRVERDVRGRVHTST